MASRSSSQFWRIEVYDSLNLLYVQKVQYGQITESSMLELLKALVSKHSLTEREIIGGFAKKRTKIHNNLLEVRRLSGGAYGFTCGDNPYAIAVVENAL